MNLLIDTHALLWFMTGDSRLGKNARDAYLNPENALFFSAASYWEICLKILAKKLLLGTGWQRTMDRHLTENSIRWLDISRPHMRQTLRLPLIHKDPFDRLLVAQAVVEKLSILTTDEHIQRYNVKTVW